MPKKSVTRLNEPEEMKAINVWKLPGKAMKLRECDERVVGREQVVGVGIAATAAGICKHKLWSQADWSTISTVGSTAALIAPMHSHLLLSPRDPVRYLYPAIFTNKIGETQSVQCKYCSNQLLQMGRENVNFFYFSICTPFYHFLNDTGCFFFLFNKEMD